MRFNLRPNLPRPLADVHVGPVGDARWRQVAPDVERIDSARRHEQSQAARQNRRGLRGVR